MNFEQLKTEIRYYRTLLFLYRGRRSEENLEKAKRSFDTIKQKLDTLNIKIKPLHRVNSR